jgi:hypothetical protein
MTMIVLMIFATAAFVWEKFGRLEAAVAALGLAYVFSLAQGLD